MGVCEKSKHAVGIRERLPRGQPPRRAGCVHWHARAETARPGASRKGRSCLSAPQAQQRERKMRGAQAAAARHGASVKGRSSLRNTAYAHIARWRTFVVQRARLRHARPQARAYARAALRRHVRQCALQACVKKPRTSKMTR